MKKFYIAPSILNAPFTNLEETINSLYFNGATYLHFDVMDGHFVPNLSFGSGILKTINLNHYLINDVHLMVEDPMMFIDSFIDAKADIITVHKEVFTSDEELIKCLKYIQSKGVKCGVSIKPNTSVNEIKCVLNIVDLVLVMSVEPGFGGQSFKHEILKKIEVLDAFRKKEGLFYLIEVDGGINNLTSKLVLDKGADIIVVGSYLFKNDLKEAIKNLKE